jgi:radical SAM protein with 4Fe4S-binding SPASM domain
MSKDTAFKLIDYFADCGLKQITFSGGEPLIYPHIREVVSHAHDYGFIVHMNTNGYFFDRQTARDLKRRGLSQFETNIDSMDPREHDYIRGKKGSFERAVKAIKNGTDAGLICVMQTVLTKKNEDEIFDIFDFAHALGVHRSRVWDMTPSDGVARENMDALDLRPSNYMETLRKLTEFALSKGVKNIESADPLFPLNHPVPTSVTGSFCVFASGLVINVSPDGEIYFCCTDRQPIYNIFDVMDRGDVRDIHAEFLTDQLRSHRIPSDCEVCGFFEKCRGGCYTRLKYTGYVGDYWCEQLNEKYNLIGPERILVPEQGIVAEEFTE